MVEVKKADQRKILLAFDRMERELHALRVLCESSDPGHLEAGDFVEITKAGPFAVLHVQRAVVVSVRYKIAELKVRVDGTSGVVQTMTDPELERVVLRKMTGESEDEGSDGSVSYRDEENNCDTD